MSSLTRMVCYLEDYRARVGAWAGRLSWRVETKRGVGTREVIETIGKGLGLTMLSCLILSVFLIIGGIEHNPGPAVETENTVSLMYYIDCRELWVDDDFEGNSN